MRKLLEIGYGDWTALVRHVKAETRLKTGQLSKIADVSPETWWRWENKGQRPKEFEVVERFAKGFGLELDDVRWAAAMAEVETPEGDPRLRGLSEDDPVVQHIMTAPVTEYQRSIMLDRRRQQLAQRDAQDIAELEFWVQTQVAQQESGGDDAGRAA